LFLTLELEGDEKSDSWPTSFPLGERTPGTTVERAGWVRSWSGWERQIFVFHWRRSIHHLFP
jgi:hypothetical protein